MAAVRLSGSTISRPHHGGHLQWAATLAQCLPDELLDFSASISPLGPPKAVLERLRQGLEDLATYPNPDYTNLCSRLAQHHSLDPAWIFPGNGAAELLTWAGRELSGCDRTYLITPAFGDYTRALKAFGASIAPLPLNFDSFPCLPDVSFPVLRASEGILLNNPHNPTGYLLSSQQMLPLLETGGLVVVDEAFMDFLLPNEQQSMLNWIEQFPNLVILRSLTKFYSLPGLRLGYAILHPDRAKRWQQWRDPWAVNTLAALAMETAVDEVTFQEKTWSWLSSARQQLMQGLKRLDSLSVYPGTANFLLVRSSVSCTQLQEELLRHHRIFIRDCLSYPALGDRFFRIAVRTEADNQRLLTALHAVLNV